MLSLQNIGEILFVALILMSYALVPYLVVKLYVMLRIPWRWTSFLVSALIILAYPFFYAWLSDLLHPPKPDTPDNFKGFAASLVLNTFLMLPLSMFLHFLFFYKMPEYKSLDKDNQEGTEKQ